MVDYRVRAHRVHRHVVEPETHRHAWQPRGPRRAGIEGGVADERSAAAAQLGDHLVQQVRCRLGASRPKAVPAKDQSQPRG